MVIIDTDAGLDDAWAMFMMLRAHKSIEVPFKVIAITCVKGNTSVDNVTVNVTRVLSVAKELSVMLNYL